MAPQFISRAAPPKQAEENQLLEIGKKLFLKNWNLNGAQAEKEDYCTSG